jgi:hypothetical protein
MFSKRTPSTDNKAVAAADAHLPVPMPAPNSNPAKAKARVVGMPSACMASLHKYSRMQERKTARPSPMPE